MSSNTKIQPDHLKKQAVIYVRQSSLQQVQHNKESQIRQYSLSERATNLGWTEAQCVVIDDDLGVSAAHSVNRPGYQRLVSMLAMREIGIIFSLDVSRLARNCVDWYQLLDLASAFGCLIGDEDLIYDPADFNDRLLLGLRGTISEVELHQIKYRMVRGRMQKASRGDLEIRLPVGYERHQNGKTIKSSDSGVRASVESVFSLFRKINSIRGVLLEMRRRGTQMPFLKYESGYGIKTTWQSPTYSAIYSMVRNPTYAGIYVYGKKKRIFDPISKKYHVHQVDKGAVGVIIDGHHDAYISRDEHQEFLKILDDRGTNNPMSKGASREGSALLQGIAYCKTCGLKMRPRYSARSCYYCCDREHRMRGAPVCGWASTSRVDGVVEETLLNVLNAGTIDLTFKVMQQQRIETTRAKHLWDQKIQRLEYESNIARRRYESVDPENRLVAATLEAEWNRSLVNLSDAKREIADRFAQPKQGNLSIDEVKKTLKNLPTLWHSGQLQFQEKKEITRLVIERVFLSTKGKTIGLEIVWQGDSITRFEIPKYVYSSYRIYHRIFDLAKEHTDSEIASILNGEGMKTVKGRPWSSRRVMDFRLSNSIASGFTVSSDLKISDSGYMSASELAKIIGVDNTTIQRWNRWGLLEARPRNSKSETLWIKCDDALIARLKGNAKKDPKAVTLASFAKATGKPLEKAIKLALKQGCEIVRLRIDSRISFFVSPQHCDS